MDNEEPRILGDGRPLTMKWSKRERDVTISYPRGYDLTTLRFSIKQKAVVAQKRAEKNK
jgi:hypothetical protein